MNTDSLKNNVEIDAPDIFFSTFRCFKAAGLEWDGEIYSSTGLHTLVSDLMLSHQLSDDQTSTVYNLIVELIKS